MRTSSRFCIACLIIAGFTLPLFADKNGTSDIAKPNTHTTLSKQIEIKSFQSHALQKEIPFAVVSPSGNSPPEGWPTLFLLHGRGRNHLSLIEDAQSCSNLLGQPYLIVLPMTFDGWYINSQTDPKAKYSDALKELEIIVANDYPINKSRNQQAIAGWSMGGYGTLYHATHRPEQYAYAAAMIGLVDFPRPETLPEGQNYEVPQIMFGNDPKIWRTFNPRHNIENLRNTQVFLAIGEHAFDRTMNEKFLRDAEETSINIKAIRIPHAHTFQAVQEALPLVLEDVRKFFEKGKFE
jgi:S-formylglutathione hydrolase FrmB